MLERKSFPRARSRSLVVMFVIVWMCSAILSVIPTRAAAEVYSIDSLGTVFYNTFGVDYTFTWSSADCMQAELDLNGVAVQSSQQYCPQFSGETFSGQLYAGIGTGTYTFILKDATLASTVYTRSWIAPGVSFAVTVDRPTANVSETVGIQATLSLLSGGPDEYYTEGYLTVNGGRAISHSVYPDLLGPHYATYYGIADVPQYHSFTMATPLSFGSAGAKAIEVHYWDPALSASGTLALNVSAPTRGTTAAQSTDLTPSLVYIALAFGALGLAIGAYGFALARRLNRSLRSTNAPTSRSLPPPLPIPPSSLPPSGSLLPTSPPPESPPPSG